MGIYIGHNDTTLTFKALFRELNLDAEGHDYNCGTIEIPVLVGKLEELIKDYGIMADMYEEWMEEHGCFVYGHDPLGQKAFAVGCARSALTICKEAQEDGKTTMTWS